MAFLVIMLLHGCSTRSGSAWSSCSRTSAPGGTWSASRSSFSSLTFVPDQHQSLAWTFTEFRNETGWTSSVYAVLIGLLMAQYTYTGYDASAHVAEETRNASVAAPKGMVRSVWVSILAGWALLVAVTAAIQDYTAGRNSATGLPPAQIFIDAAGRTLGIFLLFICAVAQFFCGMASVTANSRMSYAFSRDGALPGSRLWAKVNPRTGTPTNSIWLCVICSTGAGAPGAEEPRGLLRRHLDRRHRPLHRLRRARLPATAQPRLPPGDWHLGRWSAPIGWIAVVWVIFIVILFMLPAYAPGTGDTFNYAPVAVLAVLLIATGFWILRGRHHFMRDVPEGHDTRSADEIFYE